MDLSSEPSSDEARIMERQLYRPGQTPPAPKTPTPTPSRTVAKPSLPATKRSSGSASDNPSKGKRILLMLLLGGFGYYLLYGTPTQRKRTLVGLGAAVWLFMLGGISYCIFLPDLNQVVQDRRAIFEDPNLTWEQKREKSREIDKSLTPDQRQQVREIDRKQRERKGNADMHAFLQMTPEEQVSYLKKRDEEWKQRRQQRGGPRGGGPRGGGGAAPVGGGAPGGGGAAMVGGGPGGGRGGPGGGGPGGGGAVARGPGGPGGGGPGGPGGGGGPGGPGGRGRLDFSSPESRAGRSYQFGLMRQMGMGPFGGGPGGGGPPRR